MVAKRKKSSSESVGGNTKKVLEQRWGKQVISMGWTAIPSLLLERQQTLQINSVELNILLILIKHWWEDERLPFPSKQKMADMIGKDKSTVQRHIRSLESKGLLKRLVRSNDNGQTSNEHDLSGLIDRIRALAKEEISVKEVRDQEDARKRRGH